jgi:hypothetical protein
VITNEKYWGILRRIDGDSRRRMNLRGEKLTYGSERMQLIRGEIPYNPLHIMREASRIATEAGVPEADTWFISENGAHLGSPYQERNFFALRVSDDADGDKLCALEVLAQVCEYIRAGSTK